MLNVWIDYPPPSSDDLNSDEESEAKNCNSEDDDSVELVGLFEEHLRSRQDSQEPQLQSPFVSPLDRSYSPIPVVSTEASSSYAGTETGSSSDEPSMPSSRFYYNPISEAPRDNSSVSSIHNQHQFRNHSSSSNTNDVSTMNSSNNSSRPQIHVQVNLPGSASALPASAMPPPCDFPAMGAHSHFQQGASHGLAGNHMNALLPQQTQGNLHKAIMNLPPALQPVHGQINNLPQSNAAQTLGQSLAHRPSQPAAVPMLFQDVAHAAASEPSPANTTATGRDKDLNANASSFYSSIEPEADFLEFQSMYYHLCDFYHTYGHSNVPRHPSCFIIGSWVDELRQRKHIQDLQERGISVATTVPPLSRRQASLLESLGFRWHVSQTENASIIEHMNLVDQTNAAALAQERLQGQTGSTPSANQHSPAASGQNDLSFFAGTAAMGGRMTGAAANLPSPLTSSAAMASMRPPMSNPFANFGFVPNNANSAARQSANAASQLNMLQHMNANVQQGQQQLLASAANARFNPFHQAQAQIQNGMNMSSPTQLRIGNDEGGRNASSASRAVTEPDSTVSRSDIDEAVKRQIEAMDSNITDSAEHAWKVQYTKLAEFKRRTGHCSVPARYIEDPKLGHWVMTQRRQFNLMKRGKPSSMTLDRIKCLTDLGFSWSIRIDPEKMWNLRFAQLNDYKKKYGDCLVPQRFADNPKLGTWVNTQRRHYKLMKEGKPSCMSAERVKILEDVGFAWSTSTNAPGSAIKRLNNAVTKDDEDDCNEDCNEETAAEVVKSCADDDDEETEQEENVEKIAFDKQQRTGSAKDTTLNSSDDESSDSMPSSQEVSSSPANPDSSKPQSRGMLSSLSEAASVIASMEDNVE